MGRYYHTLLLIALAAVHAASAQGLKFNSAELPIDKRTSYNVFDERVPSFADRFDIEFDIRLYPVTEIGYILRIKNQTSDKIYNLFYDGQGDDFFKLNEEGKCNLITAKIDREELLDAHWFRMKLAFDLKGDSITLTIHNRTFTATQANLPDTYSPIIIFGKSDHIIDVPSFAIQNLTVGNSKNYTFELSQNEGNTVYDTKGRPQGRVQNPEWLINDAYHWRYRAAFASQSVAGTNYNPLRKEVYYFNRDTLFIYNVRTEQTEMHRFAERCPLKLVLGMNFIDPAHNKLYAYEVYDETSPADCPAMACLDLDTYRWSTECREHMPTQLHHHGCYFDPEQGRYTIFGGFGNMSYSREFHTYDLQAKHWEPLGEFSGDPLFPRYFSSTGYLKENNSIYIFGGMGNESGDQSVGRYYFYDLHRLDLTTGRISKLWEIPWRKTNSVPVRNMVILNDSCFYTLCYPESVSNSYLHLYRFSIADGSYEILSDSIPIRSDKITTNANLYYDAQQDDLFATVQEFDDDIQSRMKVYRLAFPPISAEELAGHAKPRRSDTSWMMVLIIVLGATAIGGGIVWRRKSAGKTQGEAPDETEAAEMSARPNSICLFGDFMVRNRHNRDITYLFTTRQRQIFCLVLQNSFEDGISSQRLSTLLWPDKPEDKVKNSRGVTINHLRKTLSELDDVELVYSKGCFRLVQGPAFYCDYTRCMEIISAEQIGENRGELVQLLSRGKFLKHDDQPLFDSFKEEVERALEPVLQIEMEKCFAEEDYGTTLALAEAVFCIDPLNDQALAYLVRSLNRLKRNEEARSRYQAFVLEYKKTFGAEYPYPFRNL